MKKLLLMVYALLAGTLTGLAQDLDSLYAQSMLKNGMVAPDFVIDSATNARLEDLRGRFVVLHFWASWCPDCRRDTPELKRLQEEFASDSLVFIHISFDTDREAWKKAVEQYAIPYPQASELRKFHDTEIAAAYGVKWIPSLYLISPDGRVALGTVLSSRMERALEKVAKPKPSEKPLDPRDYEIDEDGALRPRLPR